jgi:hypothetical protein
VTLGLFLGLRAVPAPAPAAALAATR